MAAACAFAAALLLAVAFGLIWSLSIASDAANAGMED